jgi:hypothetical protein
MLLIELSEERNDVCIRQCKYPDFIDELGKFNGDSFGDMFSLEMGLREIHANLPISGYEGEAYLLNRAIALVYKINMQKSEGLANHHMSEAELIDWDMFSCACMNERDIRNDDIEVKKNLKI